MTELFYFVFYAVLIASFSFVYTNILFDANMILGPLFEPLDRFMSKTRFTRWLAEPLFKCAYCTAGQTSLWFYLIKFWKYDYNFFWHVGFISLTILLVHVIVKKIGKF